MKYHLLHLGCQMNQSDGERIRTVIESMGYQSSDREEDADILGIVACSVRQKAIDKVYSKIQLWNSWKSKKNLLTFVSGCILPVDREKFLDRFDLVFPLSEVSEIPDMIRQNGIVTPLSQSSSVPEEEKDPMGGFWEITPEYSSDFEAFIPIQNGCDKFCTFCAVPYTRGREISRPSEEIILEVESLISRGYKSITLLGQNVNSYGQDKKGEEISFPRLMRKIGEMGKGSGKKFWVYFTSPHPRDMTEELIQVIAEYPCLANQIHLPLQSGDDKVLIRMNRNHSTEDYRQIVQSIRKNLPGATLFTDIIVGFTGEEEEHFQNTRKAMEEFQYNMAYIAMYSPRPGAVSSRWKDQVDLDEKKRRYQLLTETLKEGSRRFNQSQLGKKETLLVDRKDRKKGYLSGKTEGKLTVRFPSENEALIGSFVTVEITGFADLSLEGYQYSG